MEENNPTTNPIINPLLNLTKLHSNLVKEGYDLPDENTFFNDMKDENKRKKLHDNLTKEGYDIADFNTFSSDLGYTQKKKTFSKSSQSLATPSQLKNLPTGKEIKIPEQKTDKPFQGVQNIPSIEKINQSFNGRVQQLKYQGQKIKIGNQEATIPAPVVPVKLSEYLQHNGISPSDIKSQDIQDRDLTPFDVDLFDNQVQNLKYKYLSPNVKSEDLQINENDSPLVKQAKLIGLQTKTNRDASDLEKYALGTNKAVIGGINDMVIKPVKGLVDMIGDIQQLSTPVGVVNAIAGNKPESITKGVTDLLSKTYLGDILVNKWDQVQASNPDLPNTIKGNIVGGFASLPGMFASFAATPEAKVAGIGLKMAANMGLVAFGNAYNEATNQDRPISEKFQEAVKSGIKGAKQGLLMEGIMYAGSGGSALKSMAVNAAGFGGLNVYDQFNSTGDVDWHAAIGSAIFGGVLGVNGGEYNPKGIQILPKRMNDALTNYFGTSKENAKTSAFADFSVEKVRKIADDLISQVIPPEKVNIIENEDGTQSVKIDVDPQSLKPEDVNKITQGQTLHNLADNIALDEHFSDLENAKKGIAEINSDESLTPEQKQQQIDRINQSVSNHDPINQKIEPISLEIEQLNQKKESINNEPISDVAKEAKSKVIDEQIKEKKNQIQEVLKPSEKPIEEKKTETISSEPKKAVQQAVEQGKPIYTDFDDTLFDTSSTEENPKLTALGEDIKKRIVAGEDITILTHRKDTPENRSFIRNMLGIKDGSKMKLGLSPEGKAEYAKDGVLFDDNQANIDVTKKAGGETVKVKPEKKVEQKSKDKLVKINVKKSQIKKQVNESKALKSDKERVTKELSEIHNTVLESLNEEAKKYIKDNSINEFNKRFGSYEVTPEAIETLKDKNINVSNDGVITIKTPKGEFKFRAENIFDIEKDVNEKYPSTVSKGNISNLRHTVPRSKSGIYDANELISIHKQNLAEAKKTGNKELADVFQKEIEYLKKKKPYESTTETPRDTPIIIDEAQTIESTGKLAKNSEQSTESIEKVDKLLGEIDNKVNDLLKPQEDATKKGKVEEGDKLQHKGDNAQLPQEGDNRNVKPKVEQKSPEAGDSNRLLKSKEKEVDNSGILYSSFLGGTEKFLIEFGKQDISPKIKSFLKGLKESYKFIDRTFRPASQGVFAKRTARIMRYRLAELARKTELAYHDFKTIGKHFDRLSDDNKLKLIDYYENLNKNIKEGNEKVGTHPEQEAMEMMQKLIDEKFKYIQKKYIGKPEDFESFIENYFPHYWKEPEKAAKEVVALINSKAPIEGSKAFLKQRTIPTTMEGIQLGFEPVTTNPVELFLLKNREMDKFIFAHDLINEFKEQKLIKFVPIGEKPEDGYDFINDRIAKFIPGYKTVKNEALIDEKLPLGESLIKTIKTTGSYAMPKEGANLLNNYLQPGLGRNPIYNAIRETGNLMNQVQLGVSFFHAAFTSADVVISRTALGIMKISQGRVFEGLKTIAESPTAIVTNLIKGNKLLKAYYGKNPELMDMVIDLQKAGGRARMDAIYKNNAMGSFFKALRSNNPIGAIVRSPFAFMEMISKPLMEELVPRQKLGVFFDLSKNINAEALKKGWPEEKRVQRLQEAWDSVDNRMGQLVYDNLFWNKALKDLSMVSVRSVGWNVGSIRELGGAPKDLLSQGINIGKNISNKIKGKEIREDVRFTPRMAYAMALPFITGLIGGITYYLYNGESPKDVKDYFYPKTGAKNPDGTFERISLPTYMKDVYAYSRETSTTIKNKLHPLIGAIVQMMGNKDYFGYNISDEKAFSSIQWLKDEASYIGEQFQPFSYRNMQQRKAAGEPLGKQIQSFFGITPAPKYLSNTDAQNEIGELYKTRFGGQSKPHSQKEGDELKRDIAKKIKEGNNEEAENLLHEGVLKGIVKENSKKQVWQSLIKRASGSFDEYAFKRFSTFDKTELLLKFDDEAFKKYFPLAKGFPEKAADEDIPKLRKRMKEVGIQQEETIENLPSY